MLRTGFPVLLVINYFRMCIFFRQMMADAFATERLGVHVATTKAVKKM